MGQLTDQLQLDKQLFKLYEMGLDLDEIAYLQHIKYKQEIEKEW